MLFYEGNVASLLRDGYLQLRGDLKAAVNILAETSDSTVIAWHSAILFTRLIRQSPPWNLLLQRTELLAYELSNYMQSLRLAVFELILPRKRRLDSSEARY